MNPTWVKYDAPIKKEPSNFPKNKKTPVNSRLSNVYIDDVTF